MEISHGTKRSSSPIVALSKTTKKEQSPIVLLDSTIAVVETPITQRPCATIPVSPYVEDVYTFLLEAINSDKTEIARDWLQNGGDINAKNKSGETSLYCAILHNHQSYNHKIKLIRFLIENKADINAKNNHGKTVLHRVSEAFVCISQDSYAKKDVAENLLMAKYLLQAGANPNIKDHEGYTALHFAAQYKNKGDFVSLLIEYKADINAKNKSGETPLHIASRYSNYPVVEVLIAHKVDMGTVDHNNNTALHYHIINNVNPEAKFIKFLIEKDSSYLNSQNKDGNTILHLSILRDIKIEELFTMLIKYKYININLQNKEGNTPAHICLYNNYDNYDDGFFELIKYGADLDITNNSGDTPLDIIVKKRNVLHYSIKHDKYGIGIFFLSIQKYKNIDINLQDADGNTPLHLCAQKKQFKMVFGLLCLEADLTIKNKQGITVEDIILNSKDSRLIKLLKNYYIDYSIKSNQDMVEPLLEITIREIRESILRQSIEYTGESYDINMISIAMYIKQLELPSLIKTRLFFNLEDYLPI